jgi:hypothetical protein
MAEKPDGAYGILDIILQILDDLAENGSTRHQYSSFLCQRLNNFEQPSTTCEGLQNLRDFLDDLDYGVTNSIQAKRLLERRISLKSYQSYD